MHEPKTTRELKVEIVNLEADNVRLRRLRVEDARFSEERHQQDLRNAEQRVELAVAIAQNVDVADLEQQISNLQKTIEEDGAVISRIVVYLRAHGSSV